MACSFALGFVKYIVWAQKHRNAFLVQYETQSKLFMCLLQSLVCTIPPPCVELLRYLTNEGFIDKKLLTCHIVGRGIKTPWEFFAFDLSRFMITGLPQHLRSTLGDALEGLLQFQVDTDLIFKTKVEDTSNSRAQIEIKVRKVSDRVTWEVIETSNRLWGASDMNIKPISSFHELVEANFPERKDLLRQIDRNLALYQRPILSRTAIIAGVLISLVLLLIMHWCGIEDGALTDQLV